VNGQIQREIQCGEVKKSVSQELVEAGRGLREGCLVQKPS